MAFLFLLSILAKCIISDEYCHHPDELTASHYCFTRYKLSEEQKAVDSLGYEPDTCCHFHIQYIDKNCNPQKEKCYRDYCYPALADKMTEYMEYYNFTHVGDYANCGKGTGNLRYPNAAYHCDDWGKYLEPGICYLQGKVPDNIKEKNDFLGYKPDKCWLFYGNDGENFCAPARTDKVKEYLEYYDVSYANCGTGSFISRYTYDPKYKCENWRSYGDEDCYSKATLSEQFKEEKDSLGYKPDSCCYLFLYEHVFDMEYNEDVSKSHSFCIPARKDRIQKYLEYYVTKYHTDGDYDYANCGDGKINYIEGYEYDDDNDDNTHDLDLSTYYIFINFNFLLILLLLLY